MVNIWSFFGHTFGSSCPLCGTPGDGICTPCLDTLPRNRHSCTRCALPLPDAAAPGSWCGDCQTRPPSFDSVLAPLLYLPPVDDLIAGFKYHHRQHLGRMLATTLANALPAPGGRPQMLLPVPMQARRLRERGFNQAAELTRWLAKLSGIAWSSKHLWRIRDDHHQRTSMRRQRRRNVRGAFECAGRLPQHVAVVDDVMTTGATANEVSRTLKRAGVARVEVWVVARTPLDKTI